ncbi:MAG: alpha-L-fucosidase [Spirochaetia bacterium]
MKSFVLEHVKYMKFRQVHLDFHTSETIGHVGEKFDKKQFQKALEVGYVNSINVFAKCHHGYAYYPSEINEVHPGLSFDLLGNMVYAAKEVGVDVQIYVSAGLDEKYARQHPEWLIRNRDESTRWTPDFSEPGFHELCLNTPYLDELLRQVEEVLRRFEPKGLWLDIVGVRPCYCRTCINEAETLGLDMDNPSEMMILWEKTYKNYQHKVEKLVEKVSETTEIIHNSGHFIRGREDLWSANTHYELESLPTGGWNYDHFPMSARYIQQFGVDFLGMTGKFHTSWGEFGGFKHYNALRYEMAVNLMNGAKCSIGDQLHPNGRMDLATYKLIGKAYEEVFKKEPWCDNVSSIADIGVFSAEVIEGTPLLKAFNNTSDAGAVRILLEEHYLFDLIDQNSDFTKYKLIILPDTIRHDSKLTAKMEDYFSKGGKVLASGESGLAMHDNVFSLDLNVQYIDKNQFSPAYVNPDFDLKSVDRSSYVFYEDSFIVNNMKGSILATFEKPYDNRKPDAFCSHQHFPNSFEPLSPGIVADTSTCYVAWNAFKEYASVGSYIHREIIAYLIDHLLGPAKTLSTSLASDGNVSLMHQKAKKRMVLHIVHGIPVMRGKGINVIEDIQPIYNIDIDLNMDMNIKKVYTAPSMEALKYTYNGSHLTFVVPKVECHQMVVIEYD